MGYCMVMTYDLDFSVPGDQKRHMSHGGSPLLPEMPYSEMPLFSEGAFLWGVIKWVHLHRALQGKLPTRKIHRSHTHEKQPSWPKWSFILSEMIHNATSIPLPLLLFLLSLFLLLLLLVSVKTIVIISCQAPMPWLLASFSLAARGPPARRQFFV